MDRTSDGSHAVTTALARRAPSHLYARAYRVLFEARYMLEHPRNQNLPRNHPYLVWDSKPAYEAAMKVSLALRMLPEFSPERVDDIYAACWRFNPATGVVGNAARVDAALAEVWRLCDDAAREEAGATAIVVAPPER